MIHFGLKLWSSNPPAQFAEAARLCTSGLFQFVELYHNPAEALDYVKMAPLEQCFVAIHNTHSHGWHEFTLGVAHLKMWEGTVALADHFNSSWIVVHPGQAKDFAALQSGLQKIADKRVVLENMAGLDVYGDRTFGRTLDELKDIRKLAPICFDFEKAVKAAAWQKMDYREFIDGCLNALQPIYFHISGGDKDSAVDQHLNLREANFEIGWIRWRLDELAEREDVYLVFETPKNSDDLENDVRNLEFFKQA